MELRLHGRECQDYRGVRDCRVFARRYSGFDLVCV